MFKKKLESRVKYSGERNAHIISLVKGGNVIHVGCTDWPFLNDEIENNRLFHNELEASTRITLGIDIDEYGITQLRNRSNSSLFEFGDVSEKDFSNYLIDKYGSILWDWILVPDVIEHVRNQEKFLEGIVTLAKKFNSRVMLTTPNQYSVKSFLGTIARIDFTHTDHRLVHNETTVQRALLDVGVKKPQLKFDYVTYDVSRRYGKTLNTVSNITNATLYLFPHWADCLVVRVEHWGAS
jgi:2-polyprenyl-3-methyl-5-hydroxy-6-metoxy-1,4-benzoquinol methylase